MAIRRRPALCRWSVPRPLEDSHRSATRLLFELRNTVPDVTPAWVGVRDLFLAGRTRAAWQGATSARAPGSLQSANDFLLNIEIARAAAAHKIYLALVRRAAATYPDEPLIQLYFARSLAARRRHVQAIEYLLAREATLGKSLRPYWCSQLACMYGEVGLVPSSHKWLAAVQGRPGAELPLTLYSQSCAYEGMRQWDEAIVLAQRTVAAAPNWSRARSYLVDCLLARGRVDDAEFQLAEARRLGHEDATIDIARAMLDLSLGRFAPAREGLQTVLEHWPQADFVPWARRTLYILLVEAGQRELARQLVDGREAQLALPTIPAAGSGRHLFLHLPLIAQNKDQCVPTSVAMAAYPQGLRFQPDVLFAQMNGRDGTPLWRMRRWVESQGLHLVPIRLEREGIVALLDQQIPLIGILEGAFHSHVEVLCGYNDDLDTVYVRDPVHWAPLALPWDMARSRYALHAGVLAVIAPERSAALAVAHAWRSSECAALIDLAQAVAQGHVADAEQAYGRIPDESPAAAMREGQALLVAVAPSRFRQQMRAILANTQAHPVARFRAILSLGGQDVQDQLEPLLEDESIRKWGVGIRRYLRLLKAMNQGDWRTAQDLVERLLLTGGGIWHFWELKSDILAELGDQQASQVALDTAIELAPFRMSLREKALRRSAKQLTLAQYLAEFESLLASDPDDKRLLWGRTAALLEGPDGKAFERSAQEALRWFPRNPQTYVDLLNWYEYQRRDDLVQQLLVKARHMLPDEFAAASASGGTAGEAAVRRVADLPKDELPSDLEGLLRVIATPNDVRHEAALARAVERQQAGQLQWHEVARLSAQRLLATDRVGNGSPDPEQLLTLTPPGAPHWFAHTLCSALTAANPSPRLATAVGDWLVRLVPDRSNYPDLWFERVLLLEHARQLEQALSELRALLERYPANSAALFRMGVVKYRQRDYPAARENLRAALDVNPGLFGAIDLLRHACQQLGRQDEHFDCLIRLRRKMPYAQHYLHEEAFAVAQSQSLSAAESLLANQENDFPAARLTLARARLLQSVGRLAEADRLLDSSAPPDANDATLIEDYLQAKMDLAFGLQNPARILALCDEGLARWPDSLRLKEIKAEHLAATNVAASRALLRQVLLAGVSNPRAAHLYFSQAAAGVVDEARALIDSAAPAQRQKLAENLAEGFVGPNLGTLAFPYLQWAYQSFPDSEQLARRLVYQYLGLERPGDAQTIAQQLYGQNRDDPDYARLLGQVLMYSQPDQALIYLRKSLELNNSADTLFEIARCQSTLNNRDGAIQAYWQVLAQDRYFAAAWTNLYLLQADPDRLGPYLPPLLASGDRNQSEYFLVSCVLYAVAYDKQLPLEWITHAIQRYDGLRYVPPYGDERTRLTSSLLAWLSKRPQDRHGRRDLPSGWLATFKARIGWPGRRWIPRSS